MNKKSSLFFLFSLCISLSSFSQTFTGTGDTIPDDGSSIDFTINITGLPSTLDTVTFGIETVCIDINHTYDSDLDVSLIAPDGTQIMLTTGNGGSGQNYTSTCFNQSASIPITQGSPPFTGTFRPQGQLGIVNNGQNPNGAWKLHIFDTYPFADYGIVNSWSITFGSTPASAFFLSSSNLPIVVINSNGQGIPNNPKVNAHMGIIYNGPGNINYITDGFNNYDGKIGIELRGTSSLSFPQKQYSIETRDTAGAALDISVLDMPAENDWILYAPYDDKSCMRNALTYYLSNAMGMYAVKYKFCEVIVNGQYMGIYAFSEKIKQGPDRVDIASLTVNDTTGDDLTGGYIVKIDWIGGYYWTSEYLPDQINPWANEINFQNAYPKDEDILPVQQNYIQLYVDSFEDAMASATFYNPVNGWRKYADESSFIDYFILNEISKNVDAYRLSTFFYKDKDSKGGKIKMGPVWDFNLAWRNADYCNSEASNGWAYRVTDFCATDIPFWWKKLMMDAQFKNQLKCRWTELRNTFLDTAFIFNYIDSVTLLLGDASVRHFNQWPILGIYVWPNPAPLANTFQDEIDNMKLWITNRVAWIDANLPGNCISTGGDNSIISPGLNIYPQPASDHIFIDAVHPFGNNASVNIYNALGRQVWQGNFEALKGSKEVFKITTAALSPGLYLLNIYDKDALVARARFLKM